jgi:tetratricopeptide (TPR) repeat protein/DNA-binding winged helix-turn-helix (wHTH) protein
MKLADKPIYRLAELELDPARSCLRRNGGEQVLRQKSLQVLLYLLEHRERLVGKEELIENVWAGTAVTDDALVQIIVELRKTLGDDSRQPRFIRTVPKAGYHFIGPVEVVRVASSAVLEIEEVTSVRVELETPAAAPPALPPARWFKGKPALLAALGSGLALALLFFGSRGAWREFGGHAPPSGEPAALSRVPGKRAVAVLYFENQSGDRELDWLRAGLADMLLTNLSRSPQLAVLGRGQLHALLERLGHAPDSPVRLDEALDLARGMRAEVVVRGSFARLDGQMRVDAQLYDARDGQLLTAERLVVEQPAQLLSQIDLLSLKLAAYLDAAASQSVQPGLTGVMTDNLQAYRYYSLGVEKAQTLLYVEAVALLEKAVALDPEFAMAHARIGYTYALSWARLEEGKPYLERAFRLADRLTEKDRLSITAWYAVAHADYPQAIELYRQLIVRYPLEVEAYWRLSRLLRGEERLQEAVDVAKQGLAVDASAKDLYNVLGINYMEMSRHDEAIATLRRYTELAPNDPNIYDSLGLAYQWAGRYAEAIAAFEQALALNSQFEIALLHLGNTYVWQGRYQAALEQYQRFLQVATFDANRARGHDSIAMLHLKRKDFAQAERAARIAVKYRKNAYGTLLELALTRGDPATAAQLTAGIEISADRGNRGYERTRAYYRGSLALKLGRAAEAIEQFQMAINHRPLAWFIEAYEDCLAQAYLKLGRLEEAIAEYERILRINPHYPLAHYHLGQAYERKSERDNARAAYERFLQVWQAADADIPEVVKAKTWLANSH